MASQQAAEDAESDTEKDLCRVDEWSDKRTIFRDLKNGSNQSSCLRLSYAGCSEEEFQLLADVLETNDRLRIVDFLECNDFTPAILNRLSCAISRNRNSALKSVFLSLHDDNVTGCVQAFLEGLVSSHRRRLERFGVDVCTSCCGRVDGVVQTLARSLPQSNLLHIRMNGTVLTAEGAIAFAKALSHPHSRIREFHFDGETFNAGGVEELLKRLKHNRSLKCISFGGNQLSLSEETLSNLREFVAHQPTVRVLRFEFGTVDDAHGRAIADGLKSNTTLTHLGFDGYCGMKDCGSDFGSALRINKTLKELDLSETSIGASMVDLAASLAQNTTLTKLWVADADMTDSGMRAIADALRINKSLRFLDIQSNGKVTAEGMRSFWHCLRTANRTLRHLILFETASQWPLVKVLQSNTSLIDLEYEKYQSDFVGEEECQIQFFLDCNKYGRRVFLEDDGGTPASDGLRAYILSKLGRLDRPDIAHYLLSCRPSLMMFTTTTNGVKKRKRYETPDEDEA